MGIWFKPYTVEALRPFNEVKMLAHLDIRLEEIGEDYLTGSMPVDDRTQQPFGILHGGASVVLAESLGSIASNLVLDHNTHYAVGLDVNANHLRSVSSGRVTGVAKPLHLGRSTHVWEIKIMDQQGKLCVISRLTMAVMERKS
jgi:1,4-dihydroxy-2-naphthoyl-CoA hydrolase